MIIQVDSQCPCCRKMVDHLTFWKKVGEVFFHLCEDCAKKPSFTTEELLSIGYEKGIYHGRDFSWNVPPSIIATS